MFRIYPKFSLKKVVSLSRGHVVGNTHFNFTPLKNFLIFSIENAIPYISELAFNIEKWAKIEQ